MQKLSLQAVGRHVLEGKGSIKHVSELVTVSVSWSFFGVIGSGVRRYIAVYSTDTTVTPNGKPALLFAQNLLC